MKLTLQLQLLPDEAQAASLLATMERFNEAANWLAGHAFARRTANNIALQKLHYHEIRQQFGLSSQMRLVNKAKDTGRGLAVEDLEGIRERTRSAKPRRARMAGWAFFQLRIFLTYEARLSGVSLVAVDPRNKRHIWDVCGRCDKANRKNQAHFWCRACSHRAHADINAARNIRARAAVNQPMFSERGQIQAPTTGKSAALQGRVVYWCTSSSK